MSPDSLEEEQERHTLRTGFATDITGYGDNPNLRSPTSTITYDYGYAYAYSNCTTSSNWWRPEPKSDEEQKKAWRAYWQSFYVWRGTKYRDLRSQISRFAPRHSAKIPCLQQLRKQAMSPVMLAHRQFMAKVSRPTGFLHSRTF